jgi:thymidine kinase
MTQKTNPEKIYGNIELILGCMFSGKTSALIKEYKKWDSISRNIICINFIGDNRYGQDEKMYSHDLHSIKCEKVDHLCEVDIEIIKKCDIILINEGQFFDDIVEESVRWCEEFGKDVIVSGLDGDFERKPMGRILELIPYCNKVTKLNAFCCKCANGTLAQFSMRTNNKKEQKDISNDYIAVCRKHYVS